MIGSESSDAPLPPGFIIENDRLEWWLLHNTRAWSALVNLGASVGNFSTAVVSVPPKGATLSVVTIILNLAATQINWARAVLPTGLSAGSLAAHRDARAKGTPQTLVQTRQGAQVITTAGGFLPGSINSIENPKEGFSVEAPSQSSGVLVLESPAANAAITALIFGYERPATPDELTI